MLDKGRFVSYFFLLLCVFSLFMVWILLDKKEKKERLVQQISRFEAKDFTYYKIENNILSTKALGGYARENLKEEYELENLIINNFRENQNEVLAAKFAKYEGNQIHFTKGVNYLKDSIDFYSLEAIYFLDSKSLQGKGNFTITGKEYKFKGKDILYENQKVFAKNIYGKIRMDK